MNRPNSGFNDTVSPSLKTKLVFFSLRAVNTMLKMGEKNHALFLQAKNQFKLTIFVVQRLTAQAIRYD